LTVCHKIYSPCHVRPHAWLKFFFDQQAPLFGAEYHVNHVLRVCVRQCVAPPGLDFVNDQHPALTGWANFWSRLRRFRQLAAIGPSKGKDFCAAPRRRLRRAVLTVRHKIYSTGGAVVPWLSFKVHGLPADEC
jgi:hypothetical protein